MKKTNKILLVAVILAVFFTAMPLFAQSNPSLERLRRVIPDEFIVAPDPNNPIQGTWYNEVARNQFLVYVIRGMEATTQVYNTHSPPSRRKWTRHSFFAIQRRNGTYITASPLGGDAQISLFNNNNTLTLLGMTFERYINE